MELADQLLESWAIHNRILLDLLASVPPEALSGKMAGGKGRSVGQMFAHVHNIRLSWVEAITPPLMNDLAKLEAKKLEGATHDELQVAFRASEAAIAQVVKTGLESGRINGFRPHPSAFYSYMIAHEWYHIGEIGIVLNQSGYPLDQKTAYRLWEWNNRLSS